jgi:hypothetical protein
MPHLPPTFAQIKTVQKVLYDHVLWRDIEGELESVDGTMDTRFSQESHTVLRCPPNQPGCTPGVDPVEGAKHADNVARLLFKLGGNVERIEQINAADKADLVTGVDELAKSWQARAECWRAIARGAKNLDSLVNAISVPFRKSTEAFARVQEYLQ